MPRIDAFLKLGREQGSSDIHFAVGMPPLLRINGELIPIRFRDLENRELQGYVFEILTDTQKAAFRHGNDLDFSYMSPIAGRFRVNLYRKSTGVGAAFRHVPEHIPSLSELALPAVINALADHHQGLLLVTGSTGTGKSTTLAAILDHINRARALNIITLEDPIEFMFESRRAQVVQREVGTHVESFAAGLRAAMREDPDIIMVGELRDPDSLMMAMIAAETGHLVLGTLHTTSAVKTIDRIIDALPIEQRAQGKSFLAQNLRGVITQVLVKTADGRSRRAVTEILVMNHAIGKLLMSDKTHQIPSMLQTGREQGMQLLDQALLDCLNRKEIDPNDAYLYAQDKKQFQRFVTDASILPPVNLARGG
ncbi:type IV pilus twitching motility protein PilT [Acidihalobacter ferrooxydans]|uniref:Type IV pili twitching motility protein PilT n=1 Tax=Acidihalobacter ferrooxydans TaxID=1765967 RepID=A0A1P8UE95_9GAMM|nr:PilT/PilU family type 4a pilus ATPase [Acidihalobacter ferrooxydans]APZ42119.1 type IV pili twitching motility protein PilT [Acidihalobacter ferrooxydans]